MKRLLFFSLVIFISQSFCIANPTYPCPRRGCPDLSARTVKQPVVVVVEIPGETSGPEDGELGEISPPEDGESGEILPPEDGEPGEILPLEDGKPGEISPPEDGEPGEILPPEYGEPGEISPPEHGKPGEISPPEHGEPGEISPPEDGEPGEILPPEKPDGGRRKDYEYHGLTGYKLHIKAANWTDARQTCYDEGGHLAVINHSSEYEILQQLFQKAPAIKSKRRHILAFVGVNDIFKETDWYSIFDVYSKNLEWWKWDTLNGVEQPDNGGDKGSQNCGALVKNGYLDDYWCDNELPFFCEINVKE